MMRAEGQQQWKLIHETENGKDFEDLIVKTSVTEKSLGMEVEENDSMLMDCANEADIADAMDDVQPKYLTRHFIKKISPTEQPRTANKGQNKVVNNNTTTSSSAAVTTKTTEEAKTTTTKTSSAKEEKGKVPAPKSSSSSKKYTKKKTKNGEKGKKSDAAARKLRKRGRPSTAGTSSGGVSKKSASKKTKTVGMAPKATSEAATSEAAKSSRREQDKARFAAANPLIMLCEVAHQQLLREEEENGTDGASTSANIANHCSTSTSSIESQRQGGVGGVHPLETTAASSTTLTGIELAQGNDGPANGGNPLFPPLRRQWRQSPPRASLPAFHDGPSPIGEEEEEGPPSTAAMAVVAGSSSSSSSSVCVQQVPHPVENGDQAFSPPPPPHQHPPAGSSSSPMGGSSIVDVDDSDFNGGSPCSDESFYRCRLRTMSSHEARDHLTIACLNALCDGQGLQGMRVGVQEEEGEQHNGPNMHPPLAFAIPSACLKVLSPGSVESLVEVVYHWIDYWIRNVDGRLGMELRRFKHLDQMRWVLCCAVPELCIFYLKKSMKVSSEEARRVYLAYDKKQQPE